MDVVELTRELVRIPSVNPMGRPADGPHFLEARLAHRLAGILQEMGGRVEMEQVMPHRPNVWAHFDFGGSETILFEAHLDTVPADNMKVAAFDGVIEGHRLCGRGAADVKGPMAAMLAAIDAARAAKAKRNVIFAAVCDEEYQFSGVRRFVERIDPGAIAFAVVAEPTGNVPVIAHKGVVRWRVSTHGKAVHSSAPELGMNAIYGMIPVVDRLEKLARSLREQPPHPHLGAPSLSVGLINGGAAANIVPDLCTIEIDRRLVPGETPASATKELEEALARMGAKIELPFMQAPPMEQDRESRVVWEVIHAIGPHQVDYANYCTDASFYQERGIPVVVYGPGNINVAHTAEEYMDIRQLSLGVEVYKNLVLGGNKT